jgi:TolA-binding protein
VPEALYAMAVIYEEKKGEYAKAVSTYRKILEEHPDHDTAPGAAYHRALLLRRDLGKLEEAQKAYEELLKRYPTAAVASSAKAELDSVRRELQKMR